MDLKELNEYSHRRLNPLTGEWVVVSPNRTKRPWQGQQEKKTESGLPAYDPTCYLCPGNARAGGIKNPAYRTTFIFENDFAALKPGVPPVAAEQQGLFVAATERGICRVMCFSPRHDLTVSRMEVADLRHVVDAWVEQYKEFAGMGWVRHVQIFENCGAAMGASNPHPHCQIWVNREIPFEPAREQASLRSYREREGSCLLCTYLQLEIEKQERVVCENDSFVALVPFWAVWPFETLVLSRRHLASMDLCTETERNDLAKILKQLTVRYDGLFDCTFPYSMGFHQKPCDGEEHPEWHFHAHYYPPLLRSATVKKFRVGYEMLCGPQRDIAPETAAQQLRDVKES